MSENKIPSSEFETKIRSVFEGDLPGMITRLEEIEKVRDAKGGIINSGVAFNLIDEAYHCHLWGNFLSSITMMCSSFETLFKTQCKGKNLSQLTKNALKLNLITNDEFVKLTDVRSFRNKIIHAKNLSTSDIVHMDKKDPYLLYLDCDIMWKNSSNAIQLSPTFNRIQKNMFLTHMRMKEMVDNIRKFR